MRRTHALLALLPGVLFALFALFPYNARAADINVYGSVTSNTTWTSDNTYIVIDDVTVDSGVRLDIEAGTVVKVNEFKGLYVSGTLSVNGTSGNEVQFIPNTPSPYERFWKRIQVNPNASSTIIHAYVSYAGYENLGSFYNSGGTLDVIDSEVAEGGYYGVRHDAGTSNIISSAFDVYNGYGIFAAGGGSLTFTGNSFTDNMSPVYIGLGGNLTFTHSGNTSSGTSPYGSTHGISVTGTLGSSKTFAPDDIPYVVDTDIAVPSGKTLTVEPGAVVKFKSWNKLTVNGGGVLRALGEANEMIYFTSIYDDSVAGDTNNDSTSTKPARTDWNRISLDGNASSTIQFTSIRYAGYENYGSIFNNGGTLTFEDSEVATGYYYGIRHDAGTTNIGSSVIRSIELGYGVYGAAGTVNITASDIHHQMYGLYQAGGTVTISASTFHHNTSYGIYKSAGTLNLADSIFQNNTVDVYPAGACGTNGNLCNPSGILKSGTLQNNEIWQASSIPYIIAPWLTVPLGKTLTIEEATVVKFMGATSSLYVVGTLNANGTSASSIIFTSIKDDDADGNDTNQDGSSQGSAGDWQTIFVYPNASANLTHTKIRYGGSYKDGYYLAMYNYGGSVDLDNVEIATSTVWGFYQSSGDSTIVSSEFFTASASIGIAGGTMSVSSTEIYNNDTYAIKQTGGTTNVIASNVHDNPYGAYVNSGTMTISRSAFFYDDYAFLVYGGSGHTFNNNATYLNGGGYAVYNTTANSVDAENTFWGSWKAPGDGCDESGNNCSDPVYGSVDYTPWRHIQGYFSVRESYLKWHGFTIYDSYWNTATSTWGAESTGDEVTITHLSATSDARLIVSDVDDLGYRFIGQTAVTSVPGIKDTLKFNIIRMEYLSGDGKQTVATHELGHALGLGHSDPVTSTIMFSTTSGQSTVLADVDKSDYHFMWTTIKWMAPLLWYWISGTP